MSNTNTTMASPGLEQFAIDVGCSCRCALCMLGAPPSAGALGAPPCNCRTCSAQMQPAQRAAAANACRICRPAPTLALQAGLWNPSSGPLNFFKAFMKNISEILDDPTYNWPRVCRLWQLLGGGAPTAACLGASPELVPAFRAPPTFGGGISVLAVMASLRDHYDFSPHDP